MSNAFWKGGETFHIVRAMKYTGDKPGVIAQWKEGVEQWARSNPRDPDAAAVLAWLPLWQPRPFYTAEELAPMWPALAIATGFTNRWPSGQIGVKCARRLENELDFHLLPRLSFARQYFICERINFWQRADEHAVMRELQHALG